MAMSFKSVHLRKISKLKNIVNEMAASQFSDVEIVNVSLKWLESKDIYIVCENDDEIISLVTYVYNLGYRYYGYNDLESTINCIKTEKKDFENSNENLNNKQTFVAIATYKNRQGDKKLRIHHIFNSNSSTDLIHALFYRQINFVDNRRAENHTDTKVHTLNCKMRYELMSMHIKAIENIRVKNYVYPTLENFINGKLDILCFERQGARDFVNKLITINAPIENIRHIEDYEFGSSWTIMKVVKQNDGSYKLKPETRDCPSRDDYNKLSRVFEYKTTFIKGLTDA